jgi:hypothetical protein
MVPISRSMKGWESGTYDTVLISLTSRIRRFAAIGGTDTGDHDERTQAGDHAISEAEIGRPFPGTIEDQQLRLRNAHEFRIRHAHVEGGVEGGAALTSRQQPLCAPDHSRARFRSVRAVGQGWVAPSLTPRMIRSFQAFKSLAVTRSNVKR